MTDPAPATPALDLLPPPPAPDPSSSAAAVPAGDAPPAQEGDRKLGDKELQDFCGLLYDDVFCGLGAMYVGRPVELPEKRAEKRGRQLAAAFRELGWDDAKVILLMGLCAGLSSDLMYLKKLKDEAPAPATGAKA